MAKGAAAYAKISKGAILSMRQHINAKCYECMGYFADGPRDCEIPKCPLYPFHPYNPNPIKKRPRGKKVAL